MVKDIHSPNILLAFLGVLLLKEVIHSSIFEGNEYLTNSSWVGRGFTNNVALSCYDTISEFSITPKYRIELFDLTLFSAHLHSSLLHICNSHPV